MDRKGLPYTKQKSIDFLQRLLDIVLITVGWSAFIESDQHPNASLLTLVLACLVYELLSALAGLHSSQRSENLSRQVLRIASVTFITFMVIASAGYIKPAIAGKAHGSALLHWGLTSLALLAGWRVLVRTGLSHLRRLGLNTRRAAIVGSGHLASELAAKLAQNDWMGIQALGIYHDRPEPGLPLPCYSIEQLLQAARRDELDIIYLALQHHDSALAQQLLSSLADCNCAVYLVPDLFTRDLLVAHYQMIDGIPAVSVYDSPLSLADQFMKRALDIVFSAGVLVLLSPLMAGIGLAVRLTSPGPALFKQTRYGLNGRKILVWKFRSMTTMDDGDDVPQAQRGDARVTPLGSFLRRSSLDELPQFINVLVGDMSVVGPRPHAVAHNEFYRQHIPGYMLRHKVKPGITGWAQVNGHRGETETLEKMTARIEHDIAYIRQWNILLDVKIIWLTAFKGFFDGKAY